MVQVLNAAVHFPSKTIAGEWLETKEEWTIIWVSLIQALYHIAPYPNGCDVASIRLLADF